MLQCANITKHKKSGIPNLSDSPAEFTIYCFLFSMLSIMPASLSASSHPPEQLREHQHQQQRQQKWPPPHLSHSSWRKCCAAAEMPANSIMQENTETQSNYVPMLPLKVIKQQILFAIHTACSLSSCVSLLTHAHACTRTHIGSFVCSFASNQHNDILEPWFYIAGSHKHKDNVLLETIIYEYK